MDLNAWATDGQPALSATRRRKSRRRLITDPEEAYQRALALGMSAREAAEAAQQAGTNARHARLVEEEEDRMAAARRRESRSLFGLSGWE